MVNAQVFAEVIGCQHCAPNGALLRDSEENVPQPGFVGRNYDRTRVLLIGQNPANPPRRLAERDRAYTRALRTLRDDPAQTNVDRLREILEEFVPSWPISGSYFPLEECGLTLHDIAYFNLVRCRTRNNANPPEPIARRCTERHLQPWLEGLHPRVVLFIGKWAFDRGSGLVREKSIPCDFMNRHRSLSGRERAENRQRVAALVRERAGKG